MNSKQNAWNAIWKKAGYRPKKETWQYKGFNLTIEPEVSEDNMKWYHYAEKNGIQYDPNLSPYDDPNEIMELWVDAGCPMPKTVVSSALTKEDLLNMIDKNKQQQNELEIVFGPKTAKQTVFAITKINPIKKAQFENEGVDPLELPERQQYESGMAIEEEKYSPPYHTADIIKDITPIFEKRINSMYYADGSLAWFEYKDGKIYEIKVTTAKGSQYKDYMMRKPAQQGIDKKDNLP